MANKNVTVKDATDQELGELIYRLRKERECLDLISSLQMRTSTNGVYNNTISAEAPVSTLYHEADKSLTIKNATDQELAQLMKRLRNENEVQMLIVDMKRRAQTKDEAMADDNYYNSFGVSTEVPIDKLYHKSEEALAHFGILGMHWGKSKGKAVKTLKSQKSVTERIQSEKEFMALKKEHGRSLAKKIVRNMENNPDRTYRTAKNIEKTKRAVKRGALLLAGLGAAFMMLPV